MLILLFYGFHYDNIDGDGDDGDNANNDFGVVIESDDINLYYNYHMGKKTKT